MRVPASRLIAAASLLLAVAACGGPSASPPADVGTPPVPSSAAAVAPPTATPTQSPIPSPTPAPLKLLWQAAGPTQVAKTETYWPAIDPVTGDVWVADAFDNTFWIFRPDGTPIGAWGTPGKGPGQFKLTTNDPNPDAGSAIAFAPDGSFYVTDVGNYRVERFDAKRAFVSAWGSFGTGDVQFVNPKGIATDGKEVFVADDGGQMRVFDTDGHYLRSFAWPFVLFSLGPDHRLHVADWEGAKTFDLQGRQEKLATLAYGDLGGSSADMVVDAAGNQYVALQEDGGPIGLIRLDASGAMTGRWSSGAETLALAPDGSAIYMAYSGPVNSGWPYLRKYALPAK